jgi:N-acetylmuramoyl-L-alanine amidase
MSAKNTAASDDTDRPLLPVTAPSRRLVLLGAGTVSAALALGVGTAEAAPPTLRRGSRGAAVTTLQKDLTRLKYWCGTVDGSFGHLTQQAVWALQKSAGLSRDGVVGPRTYAAIARGVQPPRQKSDGYGFEVDLSLQVMTATWNGTLRYILNTSTGSGERYYSGGRWKTATTPKGDFRMFRFHSGGWQSGPLGNLYRPAYYDRGWAIHGSTDIPPYPASHGCCRLSVGAADMLWAGGWMIPQRRVFIHS